MPDTFDNSELDIQMKALYGIESNVPASNPELGKTYYRLTCGDGNGYGFYQDGEHILNARKISIERVGATGSKGHNSSEFIPSKIILAESGDIYFEARGGDIIMKGNNIIMMANGSENDEGHIIMGANNRVFLEGKDMNIQTTSGSIKMAAQTNVTIGGGGFTYITGGKIDISEGGNIGKVVSFVTNVMYSPVKAIEEFLNGFFREA